MDIIIYGLYSYAHLVLDYFIEVDFTKGPDLKCCLIDTREKAP